MLRIVQLLLLFAVMYVLLNLTRDEVDPDPVRTRITELCEEQAGYADSDKINACVEKNIRIMKELQQYPDDNEHLVRQCRREENPYDFEAQKACLDKYRESEDILDAIFETLE